MLNISPDLQEQKIYFEMSRNFDFPKTLPKKIICPPRIKCDNNYYVIDFNEKFHIIRDEIIAKYEFEILKKQYDGNQIESNKELHEWFLSIFEIAQNEVKHALEKIKKAEK